MGCAAASAKFVIDAAVADEIRFRATVAARLSHARKIKD
jgi:hypothetical protein